MDLSGGMKALRNLEMFNLTMLMSSTISLVFCSNKRSFFDLNDMSCLIPIPSIVPSASVLTGFDCI